MPALERGERVRDLAAIRPRLARPAVLLHDRHEVDETLALDEVADEVRARAHPHLRRHVELEDAELLGRHQAAVGNTAREVRRLGAEQHLARGRVDPIGADEEVHVRPGPVGEGRIHAAIALGEPDQAVADVDAVGRHRAEEGGHEVRSMRLVMRKAEGFDHPFAEWGTEKRSAVVPSALMPGERLDTHRGQLVGEAEPVQDP